jgi:hypothetical protein
VRREKKKGREAKNKRREEKREPKRAIPKLE